MIPSVANRLILVIGLVFCQVPLHHIGQAQTGSATTPLPSTGKRWVTFDFPGSNHAGEVQIGKPFSLSLTVGGIPHSSTPLRAICESVYFKSQIVTMESDPLTTTMKATVRLEPIPSGKLSVLPKVARIQVIFARPRGDDKLDRVLTRSVYVTLGHPTPHSKTDEPPPIQPELSGGDMVADQDEVQPDVTPISTGPMAEENLVPLPSPERARAYWQEISQQVSRSWGRTVRRIRHSPSSESVSVRFRLYPDGRAQLIQVEKGSGAREIDEAGVHAVVHAQPFPPFPNDIGSDPVTVHVRMQTGVKAGTADPQPVTNPQGPDHTSKGPKN